MSQTFPRHVLTCAAMASWAFGACVPAGNSTPSTTDSGATGTQAVPVATVRQAPNVMTAVFEDSFERAGGTMTPALPLGQAVEEGAAGGEAASGEGALLAQNGGLGPDWQQAATNVWHIENGRLCGQGAKNHGVWLKRILPINARIEFDAMSDSPDGDIKSEVWGDGQSSATSQSYTNATSYLAVLGGWKNTFHVLARINEHGTDRKEIKIDPTSDDPREKPVTRGQSYHFKIERKDGKVVRWSVDGLEYLNYADSQPLAGIGHDHFGFNDWEVKVCFDNVKVTPL